ncbi:hypothetical protein A2533_04395 [Candidatus Falkowbacteria bacterium RIFOXYD2_FULL_35_9]|nr:MAG: hypothetical protein A2533_04395 [Candidatus Falkowbacteria bacterium RIFOXYD2_FULL_35_9]
MKKILITGANGFVGKKVAEFLANQGFLLTAIVRNKQWANQNIQFIEADLKDIEKLKLDKDFDLVIHLAASLQMYEKNGRLYADNIKITRKLVDYFKNTRTYFIYSSSIEVVGPTKAQMIDEKSKSEPTTPYGWVKGDCEEYIRNSGLNHAILRFGNVSDQNTGLEKEVLKILEQNKLQSWVMKNVLVDYELNIIEVEKIVQAIYKIIKISPVKQTYFLTDKIISIKDIAVKNGIERKNRKIFLPLVMFVVSILGVFGRGSLIGYICSGGMSRKYRRYSNAKILQDLNI